jgi:hypothetical protein
LAHPTSSNERPFLSDSKALLRKPKPNTGAKKRERTPRRSPEARERRRLSGGGACSTRI